MTREEWIGKYKDHIAGLAMFGTLQAALPGHERAAHARQVANEVLGLLDRMWTDAVPAFSAQVAKDNGTINKRAWVKP